MSPARPKFADARTAARLLTELGQDFAVVENLSHIFPPYDVYALAQGRKQVRDTLEAAVMDMDGTTTTTEPLCINALQTMVGRISGLIDKPRWTGLDPKKDYPHIIGNSSTRHVEYLLKTYTGKIRPDRFMRALVHGAAWTIGFSPDASRRRDLDSMLTVLGIGGLKSDHRFDALTKIARHDGPEEQAAIAALAGELKGAFPANDFARLTRASVEIYYQRYHELLSAVAAANGQPLPAYLNPPSEGTLIQPMPGIGIFLALVTGLLGKEAAWVVPILRGHLQDQSPGAMKPIDGAEAILTRLGTRFADRPARVALVTSSIAYEAGVVLHEVFRQLREDCGTWGLPDDTEAHVRARFASPEVFYDAIVTASDSCEMRLKPHRDLYSLALGQLGLNPDQFENVVGFEDSESGTIAIRAAGISVCCALPFHMTTGHGFQAATHTCVGGLPEVILREHCFLP